MFDQQKFVKVFSLFATVLLLYSVIVDCDVLRVDRAVCLTGGPVAGQSARVSLPRPDCQHEVVAGLETDHRLEADSQEENLQSPQLEHLIWALGTSFNTCTVMYKMLRNLTAPTVFFSINCLSVCKIGKYQFLSSRENNSDLFEMNLLSLPNIADSDEKKYQGRSCY